MTFDEIKAEILTRLSLTSVDADTRISGAINRHYRRITSLLGMETTRIVTVNTTLLAGAASATFAGIEKIDRLFDVTDPSQRRMLLEVSLHRQRVSTPTDSVPSTWAMAEANADNVVVLFDTYATDAYDLQADGWVTRVDLDGADEPLFPASFHDVLTWFVMAEELLRKEKAQLASIYDGKAEKLLSDLRFHLADTHTRELRQATDPLRAGRWRP